MLKLDFCGRKFSHAENTVRLFVNDNLHECHGVFTLKGTVC